MQDVKLHTNIINIAHGKFVYSNTSGSIYVSAIKQGSTITAGFVMPKYLYKENTGSSRYLSAHTSGKKDLGGFAINKTIEVPNGHILKLVNNCKRNGRDYLNGCLIVLVHEKAGIIKVDASLPLDPKNAIGNTITVFEGRGLVLSDSDVVSMSHSMQGLFVKKYRNEEELSEAFTVSSYASGLAIGDFKPIVKANGVIDISAKVQARKRKIILK